MIPMAVAKGVCIETASLSTDLQYSNNWLEKKMLNLWEK